MWTEWHFTNQKDVEDLPEAPEIFIGCMTGTSADAQADFTAAIFSASGELLCHRNLPAYIPKGLQERLRSASALKGSAISSEFCETLESELTYFLSETFIHVINELGLSSYPKDKIILSPHGQAINHQPFADPPFTDILLNGVQLSELTKYAVVSQHRQTLLQVSSAAPLAPVLIRKLFYASKVNTILLNGGGIANICVLPKDASIPLIAYDTGPANGPIDAYVLHAIDAFPEKIPEDLLEAMQTNGCDVDGKWAERGSVIQELSEKLLAHEYFQREPRYKSADRAAFDLDWILSAVDDTDSPTDVIATITEVVARSIVASILDSSSSALLGPSSSGSPSVIPAKAEIHVGQSPSSSGLIRGSSSNIPRILVYGGILHNHYVMQRIETLLSKEWDFEFIELETLGYKPDYFESLLMAYLGYCAYHKISIDLSYCRRENVSIEAARAIPGIVSHIY